MFSISGTSRLCKGPKGFSSIEKKTTSDSKVIFLRKLGNNNNVRVECATSLLVERDWGNGYPIVRRPGSQGKLHMVGVCAAWVASEQDFGGAPVCQNLLTPPVSSCLFTVALNTSVSLTTLKILFRENKWIILQPFLHFCFGTLWTSQMGKKV